MMDMRRIAIGFMGASAVVAIAAATATLGAAPQPQTIKLSVKKFEYSMKEITVKKGTLVVIEITTEDRSARL